VENGQKTKEQPGREEKPAKGHPARRGSARRVREKAVRWRTERAKRRTKGITKEPQEATPEARGWRR